MSFLKVHSSKRVYISWAPFTQYSDTYARGLKANPFFITSWSRLGLLKYLPRGLYTLFILVKYRPSIVICMNPPYFCGLTAYLYTFIFKASFCLDSHSAAFDQKEWQRIKVLHHFLVRKALFSSVTNEVWAQEIIHMPYSRYFLYFSYKRAFFSKKRAQRQYARHIGYDYCYCNYYLRF